MAPTRKECPEGCGWEGYAMHLPRHLLSEHGIAKAEPAAAGPAAEPPEAAGPATTEAVPATVVETAPRKPKWSERLRSRRGRGAASGRRAAPVPGERPPRKPRGLGGKRVPLDSDISDVWAFGGRRLEGTAHFATGRMLQYQAPAAGVILDRAVAGTLPDRIIFQRIAKNRDKYEDVAFLLAGPLLTFSITATGQRIYAAQQAGDVAQVAELTQKLQMQQEMFTWVLSMMLPRLAEGAAKAKEKAEKRDKAISEAFPELGADDPVNVLASMLFEPPHYEEASQNGRADPDPSSPDPEGAVRFGG
jgi:hypothetical protein